MIVDIIIYYCFKSNHLHVNDKYINHLHRYQRGLCKPDQWKLFLIYFDITIKYALAAAAILVITFAACYVKMYWFTFWLSIELCVRFTFLFFIDKFIFIWLWHFQNIAHYTILRESYAVAKLISAMSCRSNNNFDIKYQHVTVLQYVLLQSRGISWRCWNSCDWCHLSVSERWIRRKLFCVATWRVKTFKQKRQKWKNFVLVLHVTQLSMKSTSWKLFPFESCRQQVDFIEALKVFMTSTQIQDAKRQTIPSRHCIKKFPMFLKTNLFCFHFLWTSLIMWHLNSRHGLFQTENTFEKVFLSDRINCW